MTDPSDRPRVLIVDDDPVVRLLAGQALVGVGLEVEEARDGWNGLAAIERAAPSLVLLDVEMPGLDGFETCHELRSTEHGREIPVLIATGRTDPDTIDRAFQAGATDFIRKPIDWQLLQHRVRFLLRASDAFGGLQHALSNLRESQDRLANAQRIARLGNWEWRLGNEKMQWSDELYRLLGLEPDPAGATCTTLSNAIHPDDRARVEEALVESASQSTGWCLDHRILTARGEQRIVRHQAEVTRDESGAALRISGTLQDVTDHRRAEEQIRYLEHYDGLTGLPNRRMLRELLDSLTERVSKRGVVALLCLNLERFKRINDTLGHEGGDRLLQAVAARLITLFRTTERIGNTDPDGAPPLARIGGNEFAVVLPELSSSQDAAQVAIRMLHVLESPFVLDAQEIVMGASIGIALHPDDGSDSESLLRNANTAMHHNRHAGSDAFQFFDPAMNQRETRKLRIENGLRAALGRDELRLHYQPQRDARTGEIVGVEALLRWPSQEFGMVSPTELIPLAEETGLIEPVGEWVLRQACAQARRWRDAGLPPLRMAVNVSSHQVRRPELVRVVERALGDFEIEPGCLELEITESALIGDDPGVVDTLFAMKEMGVQIALDDFGTGYSSLTYLFRFPIDRLKIDQSFVKHIGGGEQAEAIISASVAMAHRLRLSVVAEGVETGIQEEFLCREGCDLLQGYRIGLPVEADTLIEWLQGATGDGSIRAVG